MARGIRGLRGFLAAGRRMQPARHRRIRMSDFDEYLAQREDLRAKTEADK